MNKSRLVQVSKYLSLVLRHNPEKIGLKLDPHGWVKIEELLIATTNHNFQITQKELSDVVETNDKKRFSIDSTYSLIRANQGHSVEVDLKLETAIPPDRLYHGTGYHVIDSIQKTGLCKMSRHHVHLSKDINTAKNVAKRKGKPVIFSINALAMYKQGYKFYSSVNEIWLVDYVPAKYLELI